MALGNFLGKTVYIDSSYKFQVRQTVAKVLVLVDLSEGILDIIEIEVGDLLLNQVLDYYNIPFMCTRRHVHGYIISGCNFPFMKRIWNSKEIYPIRDSLNPIGEKRIVSKESDYRVNDP